MHDERDSLCGRRRKGREGGRSGERGKGERNGERRKGALTTLTLLFPFDAFLPLPLPLPVYVPAMQAKGLFTRREGYPCARITHVSGLK